MLVQGLDDLVEARAMEDAAKVFVLQFCCGACNSGCWDPAVIFLHPRRDDVENPGVGS